MRKIHFAVLLMLSQISVFANKSNLHEFTLSDTSIIKEQFSIAENYRNNPDSAIKYYSIALEIAKNINERNYIALSYKYIGTNYFYKSDFNNAIFYWEKSLQEYKSFDDKKGIATVLGNIGIIYEYQSNYNKALSTYEEALKIFQDIQDKNGIARNLGHIGIMYEYQGNYLKALEYYQKALALNEELGNQHNIASNLGNIGIVYKAQGEYDKALEYYQKALDIHLKNENKNKLSRIYINIGIIYTIKKDYTKALEYYNKALEINKEIGNKDIIASNLENIGIIHEQQKNYPLALDYYQKALAINKETGNRRPLATNLVNISSVHLKTNKYYKTIDIANKALSISKEIGDLNLERNIYLNLSDANQYLNNLQKAIEYKNLWIQLSDSIFNIEKTKAIAEIQTRYETEKKDQEIESLQKDNEIKQLQLEENKQRTKAQRRLFLALALIFLSIIMIIWFVYKNYKKQQTINQQKLQYQKVLTEQKMLRSQMNPHFIFNSLNSIQSFISSEQSYEAEKYLARFAKLIRGILENSREDLISLDKEIEVLELYLSLEQLRFENRFSYEINVDNNIEQDFTAIPPMLVQPFVENAILHGLKSKKDGKLNINFFEKDDSLICEIDDNGVGREASAEKTSQKDHKSLATTITKDRLDALREEYHKAAYFKIEDKKDPDTNAATGTKVTIEIPIIEN